MCVGVRDSTFFPVKKEEKKKEKERKVIEHFPRRSLETFPFFLAKSRYREAVQFTLRSRLAKSSFVNTFLKQKENYYQRRNTQVASFFHRSLHMAKMSVFMFFLVLAFHSPSDLFSAWKASWRLLFVGLRLAAGGHA